MKKARRLLPARGCPGLIELWLVELSKEGGKHPPNDRTCLWGFPKPLDMPLNAVRHARA